MQKLFILAIALSGFNLHAQNNSDAEDFNQFNFQKIIQKNENKTIAIKQNYQSQRQLAVAYSRIENHASSLAAWQFLHSTYINKITELDYLELYRELRLNGKYTSADSLNRIIQSQFNNQQFKRTFTLSSDSSISVTKLDGNTPEGEYGLVVSSENKGYLTRINGTSKGSSNWLGKPHFQVDEINFNQSQFQTISTLITSENVHFEINHVDAFGNLLVTTNDINKKNKRDFNRLSLQFGKKVNGNWVFTPLKINDKFANTGHISISPNGKLAAFASDRKGNFGKTDLYLVDILVHTKDTLIFGNVRHLGREINTPSRETHPVFQSDSLLYFSSDGYSGFGGLDIFIYNLNDQTITLIPAPINSSSDDLQLIEVGNLCYFSSNRNNTTYNDDVYSANFHYVAPQTKSIDEKPFTPIESKPKAAIAKVILKITLTDTLYGGNMSNQWIVIENKQIHGPSARTYYQTDTYGNLIINNFTTFDSIYQYSVSSEPCNYNFITSDNFKIIGDTAYLSLSPRKRKIGNSLSNELQISSIHYELNKYVITTESKTELNILVRFLKTHPTVCIEITSHTDSRGSDAYNMILSQNRAKAAKDYIVSQGINPSRISSIGLGETQLLNRCANGVACSEEEHLVNRRTDYIITKLNPCISISKPYLHQGDDTDGDGVVDDYEGFTDSDGDGIPNYLDPK